MDQPALLLRLGVEELHQQLGLQWTGTQRVHADVLARVHDGELAGERQHRAFARRIGNLRRRRAEHRHERGGVDDRTAAGTAERRNPVLAPEKHTLRVHVHRQIPDRLVGRHRIVVAAVHDAGVVEQDVQLAEFPLGRRDHALGVCGPGDVGVDVDGAPARLRDCRDRVLACVVLDIDHDHGCAFSGEQQRRFPADTAAGARDERHLSVEAHAC